MIHLCLQDWTGALLPQRGSDSLISLTTRRITQLGSSCSLQGAVHISALSSPFSPPPAIASRLDLAVRLLQGGLPGGEPHRCQPRGRVRRLLEPLPRRPGGVQGLPLRSEETLPHLPLRLRLHPGEEDLRQTSVKAGHVGWDACCSHGNRVFHFADTSSRVALEQNELMV